MTARPSRLASTIDRLWRTDPLLTGAGGMLLALFVVSLFGLWFDPRLITGAPAWLKPAKFAISTAIYCLTLAWIFTYLPDWPRVRRIVGRTTVAVLVLEVAAIDMQAWRGTTSHFNVATPFDAAVFSLMGAGIALQTLTSVAVAVALWRHTFTDRVLGWALRLGMTITILGASTGGIMTAPSAAQLEAAATGQRLTVAGSHTVGAPDGGPGLPGTGWSLEHGDLRVAHFIGLHALQVLPFIAFLLRRSGRNDSVQVRLIIAASLSYAGFTGLVLWQAIRGQPLVGPDAQAVTAFLLWMALSSVAFWRALSSPQPNGRSTLVSESR